MWAYQFGIPWQVVFWGVIFVGAMLFIIAFLAKALVDHPRVYRSTRRPPQERRSDDRDQKPRALVGSDH